MSRPITSDNYNGADRREDRKDWTSLHAWAAAIKEVGIPGAIAIGLVYLGATQVPKIVTTLEIVVVEIRVTQELIREHTRETMRLIRITQKACENAAKDENAWKNCYGP